VAKPPPDWIKRRGAASERIDLHDTPAKAVFKLVQGDRAAAEACIALVKAVASADPEAEFGPLTPLVILEATGLIGPVIGALYSRVCGSDPVTALALLHAARLKLVSPATLRSAAEGKTRVDTAALVDLVRQKIPRFGRQAG